MKEVSVMAVLSRHLLSMYIVAGSPNTSTEQLRKFANSSFEKIRLRVAENQNAPIDVLEKLSSDLSHDVRVAVATNPSTPWQLVEKLAADSDIVVRHGLAQEISTPIAILKQLCQDENGWVSGEARKTLHILATWTKKQLLDKREAIRIRKRSIQRRLERKLPGTDEASQFLSTMPRSRRA
jgi:hypothetical protein